MRLLISLLMLGCTTHTLSADMQPPPGQIEIDVSALSPGQPAVVTVSGLAPFEQAHIIRGLALGNGYCIPAAGGLCLDLTRNMTYLGAVLADVDGVATYTFTVPGFVSVGADVAFQSVIVRGLGGGASLKSPAVLSEIVPPDADGDGFGPGVDCDDSDPTIYPGAQERCDGIDNDCDGAVEPAGQILVEGLYAYPSLNAALAVAQDGGTIEVCGGTHSISGVVIDRPVTIRGRGPGLTVFDGGGSGPMIEIDGADDVTLEGLTFTNGLTTTHDQGAAIRVVCATSHDCVDNLLLDRLEFTGNEANQGAALYINGGPNELSTITLRNSTVHHNHGRSEGAIYNWRGNLTIEDSTISDNTAVREGAALSLFDSNTYLHDVVIHRNNAPRGAIEIEQSSRMECTGCDLGVGADDNLFVDIHLAAVGVNYHSFWDDETFTCVTQAAWSLHSAAGECTR